MTISNRIPVVSREVIEKLRTEETPTHRVISEFEIAQSNVVSAIYEKMGHSDESLAVVRDMALMYRALIEQVKFEEKNADDF